MKHFTKDLYTIITDVIKLLVWGVISLIGILAIPITFVILVVIYAAVIVVTIPIYLVVYLFDGMKTFVCFLFGHKADSLHMQNCMQDGNWMLRSKCARCGKEIYYNKDSGEWKEYKNPNEYTVM